MLRLRCCFPPRGFAVACPPLSKFLATCLIGTMILCWTTTDLGIFLDCSRDFWSCICESPILMITSPLLSNVRHRAMITPVTPLCLLSSFVLARVAGQFIVRLKLFSKWELSIGLDFKSNAQYKSIASKNIQSNMTYVLKNT